jgi:hypothetical protein
MSDREWLGYPEPQGVGAERPGAKRQERMR